MSAVVDFEMPDKGEYVCPFDGSSKLQSGETVSYNINSGYQIMFTQDGSDTAIELGDTRNLVTILFVYDADNDRYVYTEDSGEADV